MADKSPKPVSIGRIVNYVPTEDEVKHREGGAHNGATVVPAMIVRTWEETSYQNDECNLRVFADGIEVLWRTSVPHSTAKEPGTWHWPEIK